MEEEDRKKENKEMKEDTTKYGEMISSYFAWVSPSKQKERAEELENIGKRKDISEPKKDKK